MELYDHGSQIG